MDFVNALDPSSLVLLHTGVAFLTSAFVSPSYQLPIFLFGIYAQNYTESFEPLRLFSGLVGFSLLLDILWFFNNDPATLIKLILILNWLLKILTFLSLVVALKQRGDRFGGARLPTSADFGNLPQTVWTMPTPAGRGAYQDIGGDSGASEQHHHAPPAPPKHSAPSPAPAAPTMPHANPAPAAPHGHPGAHAQHPQQGGPPPGSFTI